MRLWEFFFGKKNAVIRVFSSFFSFLKKKGGYHKKKANYAVIHLEACILRSTKTENRQFIIVLVIALIILTSMLIVLSLFGMYFKSKIQNKKILTSLRKLPLEIENLLIDSPEEVVSFSQVSIPENMDISSYKIQVYEYNQQNVEVNSVFDLVNIEYIQGNTSYMLVQKIVTSLQGSNKFIVENLFGYSAGEVYSTQNYEGSSQTLKWSLPDSSKNIYYAVETNELNPIFTIVFSDLEYTPEEVIYDYNCFSEQCNYRYCGDGYCTTVNNMGVVEMDENNQYYCPIDCENKKTPLSFWISLVVILVLGVLYINFYKGPGNFQAVANRITFILFRRKLFVTEKDRLVLNNYVHNTLRMGYAKPQIREALIKKGWNNSQIDEIFRNI